MPVNPIHGLPPARASRIELPIDPRLGTVRGLPPAHLFEHVPAIREALVELETAKQGVASTDTELTVLRRGRVVAERADREAMAAALKAGKTTDVTKAMDEHDGKIAVTQRRLDAWRELVHQAHAAIATAFEDNEVALLSETDEKAVLSIQRLEEAIDAIRQVSPELRDFKALRQWIAVGGGRFRPGSNQIRFRGESVPLEEILQALLDAQVDERAEVEIEQRRKIIGVFAA